MSETYNMGKLNAMRRVYTRSTSGMEDTAARQMSERVYCVAGGLLAACPIPASQALTLATMIVDLFRELEKLRHETTD